MKLFFANFDQYDCLQKLDDQGFVKIPSLLTDKVCQHFIDHYGDDSRYRSTINMGPKNYGEGQYRYFKYPLPDLISDLRQQSYAFLLPLARKWDTLLNRNVLKQESPYPDTHQEYIQRCHQAGQRRPTPLILHYEQHGYNCLHQDLYGELVFPLQMVILLSDPKDFEGGELLLTEQRPRMQSRAHVLKPNRGDALIFAVNHRPAQGPRGYHRVTMRHGVSTITSGSRYTLGIILHDAE